MPEELISDSPVARDTVCVPSKPDERLVITRVANNLSATETAKYDLQVRKSNVDGGLHFHLGEPMVLTWRAPSNHSRRDWIGLYRLGANKSKSVTNVNSMGKWVPVHDEEWDGDVHIGSVTPPPKGIDRGEVTFRASTLPWQSGKYEIRYHHDGKYNVMSSLGPIEVYVERPANLDFATVRATLMKMVVLCLDSDPSLIPASASSDPTEDGPLPASRDADDFRFWSERQAKRIATAINEAFDVEYAPEVIIGDANISSLANRILESREILSPA